MINKVKITKLSEAENPLHPNNIETGFIHIGFCDELPKAGESFCIGNFATSTIQEILSSNTFRTYNSIYKWEVLND